MRQVPLIGFDTQLGSTIRSIVSECAFAQPEVLQIRDTTRAIDHLNIELPDLVLMQFPDAALDSFGLLETMMGDPWLIHAGIVAVCDDEETAERLEEIRGANLIVILERLQLERQLPSVLRIIHDNRRILFQRDIGIDLVEEISGHFKLHNDPIHARCFANLICNFLYNSNRIDVRTRDRLGLALQEMLFNAIEHGNCGITYDEKTRWLADHDSLAGLIAERGDEAAVASRRVTFEYTIGPVRSRYRISDEGAGFDWRAFQDAAESRDLLELHGRGILITRAATRNLTYNEKGNEVRFELIHTADEASMTPAPFAGIAPRELARGEFVFKQGETGNCLYYIVKGRYEVLVDGLSVAILTPDDLFLGEMSFLLNDRRSATIRARTEGSLIEISKKEFVEAVKSHPHYALLLARLLAQRIDRANRLLGSQARTSKA